MDVDHYARLMRFYEKYNPEKLDSGAVEEALEKFKGQEDRLFQILTQKYGPEPDAYSAPASLPPAFHSAPPAPLPPVPAAAPAQERSAAVDQTHVAFHRVAANPSEPKEWVTVNAGGTLFTTTRATLCSHGGSLLHELFGSGLGSAAADLDPAGNVLLDCDPEHFNIALGYLRTGEVIFPRNVPRKGLAAAAAFFKLPALAQSTAGSGAWVVCLRYNPGHGLEDATRPFRVYPRSNDVDGLLTAVADRSYDKMISTHATVWGPGVDPSSPHRLALEAQLTDSTAERPYRCIDDHSQLMLNPAEFDRFRDRVQRFYEVYNPHNIQRVDHAMQLFAGREQQLIQHLVAKYGPEPSPA
jgi:hypothetical protein